ncbi:MAG: hypothetical protein QMD36_01605 [Candidatus Aenigmarchaeota archaeon]|nr:hypothetical protein [Candidatus Aenigmarchaeota archaeon]
MIERILLLASFFIFLAVAVEAKIKSNLGLFIVITGLIIGILDLIYVLMQYF